MKVLLYEGLIKFASKSGVGEAVRHQYKILNEKGISIVNSLRNEYDIVHLNTVFPDSLIISHWARWRKKKVVYFAHSTMEDFRNSFRGSNWLAPLFKKWIIHCYNTGDIIITPTAYSKKILESYGLTKPIYSLSNGIDTEFFKSSKQDRLAFREKYGLEAEQKVVLSVGHYIERKGILDFVALAKALPQYQFFWFGYTNLSLVTKDVKEAISIALPNLHFPGYVDRVELRKAYNGSDLFVFLTYEETEGIVLLEALSIKIPILIRDIAIYQKLLKENKTVYKSENLRQMIEKIPQILEGSLPDLTESGYLIALERDFEKIGEQLIEIYNEQNY